MEEWVGQIWHKLITRAADDHYPEAAVSLDEESQRVGVLFRALGGDGALRVGAAEATTHSARRGWLQRIAGSNQTVELAWRDEQTLRLPPQIALFPQRQLNRDLYRWLAAMAAKHSTVATQLTQPWLQQNQQLTRELLDNYPGLNTLYSRLLQAQLALRPDPTTLPPDEARSEYIIQQALKEPGSVNEEFTLNRAPQPVYLWLHPCPPLSAEAVAARRDDPDDPQAGGSSHDAEDNRRRRAEQTEEPKENQGLLAMRMEAIFGQAEYVKVDRGTEEEDDMDTAHAAANDMEFLSITQGKTSASRIRFDLDLPSAADDDISLGEGILLPEWDYKKRIMRDDYCCLQPMLARDASPAPLPGHLRKTSRRLRNQFQGLAPARIWYRGQEEGSEIDLDAYERFVSQRALGAVAEDGRLYRELRQGGRDLSCLLLADLSLSTDAAINNDARIIDVIRDSLYLFADALDATGDRFALYGFSSRRRDHVRFHLLKNFDEKYGAKIRGRIEKIKPGYYTRMGTAIRQSTRLLAAQGGNQKLLLILTDGKPNDLDQYEGRYGIEDTRMAIQEARRQGLRPFCVTIDKEGRDYLPHIFGNSGYVVIRRPSELPKQLPLLYAQLTA
ncbi:MAG: VWA domain-containing protein [Pseudomonadota bacterium]